MPGGPLTTPRRRAERETLAEVPAAAGADPEVGMTHLTGCPDPAPAPDPRAHVHHGRGVGASMTGRRAR